MSSAAETVGRGLRTDLQFSHVPATGDLDKKNVGRAGGGELVGAGSKPNRR